jgi:carboxypeptidase Q
MKKLSLAAAFVAISGLSSPLVAQFDPEPHRAVANQLIQASLKDSFAYKRLAQLTDGFGNRLSGSESLERAIDWIVAEMKKDGFDNVRKEPVMVPKWVRGAESAELTSPRRVKLNILGLGRSIGTGPAGITAQVLVVKNFAELRARAAEARGKIVVWNVPFESYGRTVVYRAVGADSASAVGAVASLVRSITPRSLNTPHTGAMAPNDTTGRVKAIPAAAVTIEAAEMMQRMQDRGERIEVKLTMAAQMMGMSQSHNVIAEIRGTERPDEVIVMGGHIDSWDVGQGAMDDGGGCVVTWDALRLIKQLGIRPKRTIRVVLWTNEENGGMGGTGYRDQHRSELEKHVLAMESDNGVFKPAGIRYGTGPGGEATVRGIASLLRAISADSIAVGGPEADISPLYAVGVPVITLDTDQEKYFWYHHTDADMMDKLSPVDMAKDAAIFAVVAATVANMPGTLPRVQPARPAVP